MDLDQDCTYYLVPRLQSCTKRARVHPGSLYQCQLGLWVSQSSEKSSIPQFTVIWVNGHRSFWERTGEIMKCMFFTVRWFRQMYTVISSVTQSCSTLCDPMDCSTPGLPVHHQLPEFTQTHVHWVGDAIQPSHPLSLPSPPTSNLSQHHGLFKWVSSSHQAAEVLEFQLQHQSFQWIKYICYI